MQWQLINTCSFHAMIFRKGLTNSLRSAQFQFSSGIQTRNNTSYNQVLDQCSQSYLLSTISQKKFENLLSKNNIVVGWIARRAQCELAGLVHAYVNWKFCVLSNIYFKVNTQGREQRARVLLKTYFNPRISPFTGEIEILLFSITPKNIPHHPVCLVGILIFKLTTQTLLSTRKFLGPSQSVLYRQA